MSWRSIIVANPAKLSVRNNQLVVVQQEEITIPFEDISVIIIEHSQVTLTAKLLRKISEYRILLFACDDQHLPCGIFSSFNQHSRQNKILKMQMSISQPFAKRCWQQVVQKKIENQSKCLQYLRKEGHAELKSISKKVESGDATNKEAHAAKIYFAKLFECFSRREENTINAALDYGYSIIRGALARSITAYGFLPALGIHHDNELNNFNLADDFLEVFRPVVDLWVADNITDEAELTKRNKTALVSLLYNDILFQGEKQSVLRVSDQMIASFSTACQHKDVQLLKLPDLIPLQLHQCE